MLHFFAVLQKSPLERFSEFIISSQCGSCPTEFQIRVEKSIEGLPLFVPRDQSRSWNSLSYVKNSRIEMDTDEFCGSGPRYQNFQSNEIEY